jgi:hypothetical protein
MQDNVPITSEPGRHGIADVLRLMSAVRRIAHDRTLPASEALGRIRDRFGEYDGLFDDAHKLDVHKRD